MTFWLAGVALFAVLALGAFLAARSPAFWIGLGKELILSFLPGIVKYVGKRNTPEVEAEMAKCFRMGGEWDNFRKKCRFK